MATTSVSGANEAALAGSPVQRLLLARDLSGGALAGDERMLQELCALEGSDARRQRQRRQRWRAACHGGRRLCDGFPIELGRHADRAGETRRSSWGNAPIELANAPIELGNAPAKPQHLQRAMASSAAAARWLEAWT